MATYSNGTAAAARPDAGWAVKHGLIGGVIAGIVFAMFEMVTAALMMGADALFMPLRMIGAIALGPAALEPTYPLLTAAAVGVVLHMVFSMVFGVVFALIVTAVPALAGSTGALLATATVFGFLLWPVNFFVVAPLLGWRWFPEQTMAVQQVPAHALFYGTVLGFYLDRALGGRRTA